jgi:hypothetical protein
MQALPILGSDKEMIYRVLFEVDRAGIFVPEHMRLRAIQLRIVQHSSHSFEIIPTTNDVTNAQSEWMDFHTSFFSILVGVPDGTRTGKL